MSSTEKQIWALIWRPFCYDTRFKAFIIAEDVQEANYLWNKFKKANKDAAYTWDKARNEVNGFATFHLAEDKEKENFKILFPKKRKAGVYLCDEEPVKNRVCA